MSGKGFVPAGGLAAGNAIVTRAGPTLTVKTIQWQRRAEGYTVYKFEVEPESASEDTHNYFVGTAQGGVLVHSGVQSCLQAAEVAADAAQLRDLKFGGVAAAVETYDGRTITGTSGFRGGVPGWLQDMLDEVRPNLRSDTHGRCAEIDDWRQLSVDEAYGGTVRTVRVRPPGNANHKTPVPACTTCEQIAKRLGVDH